MTSTVLLPLALLVASAGASSSTGVALPSEVSEGISHAIAVPDAYVVPLTWSPKMPQGCAVRSASVSGQITGSAQVAVRLLGKGCSGWGWLRFELRAKAAVTTRAVRAGEPLEPALTLQDREVKTGRAPTLPPAGALAACDLPPGTTVEARHVAGASKAPGEVIKVVVLTGPLAIEMQGRSISCGAGRSCAVLPSGRHVEGRFEENRLVVELP